MAEMGKNHFDKLMELNEKRGMKSSKFLRKKSSVLMLSGGVDSVSVLKRVLDETDEYLYVHHIHLKNDEGLDYKRYMKEAEACRKVVPYMKKKYRNFNFTESTIDTRQINQLLPSYWLEEDDDIREIVFIPDMVYYYSIAGVVAKISQSDKVYIGTCAEDYSDNSQKPRNPWYFDAILKEKDFDTIDEALAEIDPNSSKFQGDEYGMGSVGWEERQKWLDHQEWLENKEWLDNGSQSWLDLANRQMFMGKILDAASYPYKTIVRRPHDKLIKKESIQYLGEELMDMVWYCRDPSEKNGEFVACNECRSCMDVNKALGKIKPKYQ